MVGRKKACDSCHRRKIQCLGNLPQCNWCKQRGVPCTFDRETSVRKKVAKPAPSSTRNGSQNDLAKRMDRIEQILQAAQRARFEPDGTAARNDILTDPAIALAASLVTEQPSSYSPSTAPSNASPSPAASPEQRRNSEAPAAPPAPWTSLKVEDRAHIGGYGHQAPAVDHHAEMRNAPGPAMPGTGGVGFGKLHFAGMDLGGISSFNGIPYFSNDGLDWIRDRCGEEPRFESIFAAVEAHSASAAASPESNGTARISVDRSVDSSDTNFSSVYWGDGQLWQTRPDGWFFEQGHLGIGDMPAVLRRLPAVELPDRALLEHCVKLFRSSPLGLTLPVIDPVLFARTMDVAYSYYGTDNEGSRASSAEPSYSKLQESQEGDYWDQEAGSPAQHRRRERLANEYRSKKGMEAICAKACIFSFMSITGIIETEKDEVLPPIDGDAYGAATHLMIAEFLPAASVTSVETALMLSLFHMFSGQLQASTMFHMSATRILFMLGAHIRNSVVNTDEDDSISPSMNEMNITNPDSKLDDPTQQHRPPEKLAARLRRHVRNLFRICYMFDKEMALRTGHPPGMDDDYIDLTLLERAWSVDLAGLTLNKAMPIGITGYDPKQERRLTLLEEVAFRERIEPQRMRLYVLKARTSRLLYSVASMRKSDAELLRDIRELDDAVEQWRASLPASNRPSLVFSHPIKLKRRGSAQVLTPAGSRGTNGSPMAASPQTYYASQRQQQPQQPVGPLPPPSRSSSYSLDVKLEHTPGAEDDSGESSDDQMDPVRGAEDVITHFEYHYLMATIHRASGRCRAWMQGGEMAGLSSSQAIAVQASRSTLAHLRHAVRNVHGVAFWVIFFYPMSAILTMFCNILMRPADPQARDDLALMDSVTYLIKDIKRRRQLTPNEIVHVTMVDDFVAELTRLGCCAVNKAEGMTRRTSGVSLGVVGEGGPG